MIPILSNRPFAKKALVTRGLQFALILVLLAGMMLPFASPVKALTIPTFNIVSVAQDDSVTIETFNFPANHTFTVRMGAFGTLAIGGIVVATTDSDGGGSFEATYSIPDSLKGSGTIAIRMDSTTGGFFAFNFFTNNTNGSVSTSTPGPSPTPGTVVLVGIPTFNIESVDQNNSVTILTNNFPAGLDFTVRMGAFGTAAIGGIVVGTTNSGGGGSFQATYNIPSALQGTNRIAIRMDSTSGGFFAFNWFWNTTANVSETATPGPSPTPGTVFSGIPTFNIESVDRDNTVTILTNNFPADVNFTVRMGAFGTLGIGGIVVGTTNSGGGGSFQATYDIPSTLAGSSRIAIRMDADNGGFFSFNWFWNNTANISGSTATPGPTVTPGPSSTPGSVFNGIPTFSIQSVVKDDTVTIRTNNFPANQTFTVRMGLFGTLASGGTVVGTTDSGGGGTFTATYTIPPDLVGQGKIAIRMDASAGFFAFNWFWNTTTN
jgi:hypothetical protein